jgi:hypothetical protein
MTSKDEIKSLKKAYKYETDEELKRKREVFRSLVLQKQDPEANHKKYEALSSIIRGRERIKARREFLKELTGWLKLVATFAGGVVISPWLIQLIQWLAKKVAA